MLHVLDLDSHGLYSMAFTGLVYVGRKVAAQQIRGTSHNRRYMLQRTVPSELEVRNQKERV